MATAYMVENKRHGTVSFKVEGFPSCCGVSIIRGVFFSPKSPKHKQKLYDWFYNTVIFGKRDMKSKEGSLGANIERSSYSWRVNKFIMADRTTVRFPKTGSIYEFCHSIPDIKKGDITNNPNSSYKIQVFELNRPKNKYSNCNGEYFKQEKK